MKQESLRELVTKYEVLVALRESREAAIASGLTSFPESERPARRVAMSRLAARFPGALRELDALKASSLRKRLEAVRGALEGGAIERWMPATALFHEALREALALRRGRASAFWEARPAGRELVLRPTQGRVLDAVWTVVGEELGMSAGEAERLLYPGAPSRGVRS